MVDLAALSENLALGFSVALSWEALFYAMIGVTLGTFVGVLPGVGTMSAIAMLLPLTFLMEPALAIIMLAGIYYGGAYGGSTASILLNLPGTPSSAVTCLDGYPMARNGRAGVALFVTTIASFAGSIMGLMLLALVAPPLAQFALQFRSPEYFSLMVLGLMAAAILASSSPFRSLASVVLGLLLGVVGIDMLSGTSRFTFGWPTLFDGLPLVAVVIGLFGVPELIANVRSGNYQRPQAVRMRDMLPSRDDWKRIRPAMLRGGSIGAFFGALPGTGGMIASFMAYAVEKRVSRTPARFGKGAIEGVAAPETANNSAVQTAFIPTLTLGIPGDPVMALMLGALMIHGITPGTALITSNPDIFWGLIVSFLVGNVMLLLLNIPLINLWIRVLSIPRQILFPAITAFVCIGVYSVNLAVADIVVLMVFGLLGYALMLLRFQTAPLVLGLILGPMMEENLRRSLLISRGDPMVFLERPISATFLGLAGLLLVWLVVSEIRRRRQLRAT
ncbi:MAG: tripartite tricarboxylate transporter permease [Rhodobacteraceae bacterium]|nr:tripartite tricarboxylate transporter permease [Paracoccaceae bacterium]